MCRIGLRTRRRHSGLPLASLMFSLFSLLTPIAFGQAQDPGVRKAVTDGAPPPSLPGLTGDEQTFFQDGLTRFQNVEEVSAGTNNGLGPRSAVRVRDARHIDTRRDTA